MKLNKLFALAVASPLFLVGCVSAPALSTTTLGQGGSVVSGAAADAELAKTGGGSSTGTSSKSSGEGQELRKCNKPIATVALAEDDINRRAYAVALSNVGLPPSPIPLLRLMFQQSGCFQIVDRGRGLSAITAEQKLAEQGLLREDSNVGKGQLVAADYTITPNLVFSEADAGGAALGAAVIGGLLGVGGGISASSKEAQVVLFLTDNRSGIQVASAEGSGKVTDINFGGLLGAGLGSGGLGAGGSAWGNTNQGKVVAAALLDATNKMINVISSL